MIAQRVIKAHILVSGYLPHNVPITKDLTKNVNNSCSMYKTVLKEKKKQLKKTEKNEKIEYLNEEITQISHKKSCLEEIIKEDNLESVNFALEAEQNENLELWKLSNGLKCVAKKKAIWIGQYPWKKEMSEKKKK